MPGFWGLPHLPKEVTPLKTLSRIRGLPESPWKRKSYVLNRSAFQRYLLTFLVIHLFTHSLIHCFSLSFLKANFISLFINCLPSASINTDLFIFSNHFHFEKGNSGEDVQTHFHQ